MAEDRSIFSLGRLAAMVRAIWHLYWYVVVQGVLAFDGWWKDRKRRKKRKKEDGGAKNA